MKRLASGKLILAVMAAGIIYSGPACAQSAGQQADSSSDSFVHVYDLSKEVKISGTIQKIETGGTTLPLGTHILVQTPQGVVDAHLGMGAPVKPSYLGIAEGQSVTLVGMMETIGSNQVLLARLLTTSNHIFVLRNERGIPVRANPRHTPMAEQRTEKGGL